MKRFLFLCFAASLFIGPLVHAEDCMHDPVYDRDWNAVVTTGVRIRDIPCMETSEVLAVASVGEVLHVIAETDGYYKIERKDGTIGWIGQWLVAPTDTPFAKDGSEEPLYDAAGHPYETAIRYLAQRQIVRGYPDGSYQPDATVNRAEFTKILVGAVLGEEPASSASACFPDVGAGDWFSSYVCYAKQNGYIGGYPDGTFKPADPINLAEAAKILVNTLSVFQGDTPADPWYRPYITALQNQSYIPDTLKAFGQNVTRGEMAEFIWRIKEAVHTSPFSQFTF